MNGAVKGLTVLLKHVFSGSSWQTVVRDGNCLCRPAFWKQSFAYCGSIIKIIDFKSGIVVLTWEVLEIRLYVSYLSVCLSVHPSVRQSIRPSIHPSIYLSIYMSVCLSIYLSICLSVSVYPSIHRCVCLSVCVAFWKYYVIKTYVSREWFADRCNKEYAVAQLVEALRYKPEGREFDSRQGHSGSSLI